MSHDMVNSFLRMGHFLALHNSFMTKIVASEAAMDMAMVFMGAPS